MAAFPASQHASGLAKVQRSPGAPPAGRLPDSPVAWEQMAQLQVPLGDQRGLELGDRYWSWETDTGAVVYRYLFI